MSDPAIQTDDMPLSADLAATALWLRDKADSGVVLEPVAALFVAEAIDETALRVRQLEQDLKQARNELRSAHLARVIGETHGAADDIATELAIGQGVIDGVVHDLRGEFLRELITRGRPVPPHLLALADDGDAA